MQISNSLIKMQDIEEGYYVNKRGKINNVYFLGKNHKLVKLLIDPKVNVTQISTEMNVIITLLTLTSFSIAYTGIGLHSLLLMII